MPLITSANARELAAKSQAARRARKQAAQVARSQQPASPDELRTVVTKNQIDFLDRRINEALEAGQYKVIPTLTAAKARLWALVQPTAGAYKPKTRDQRQTRNQDVREANGPYLPSPTCRNGAGNEERQ